MTITNNHGLIMKPQATYVFNQRSHKARLLLRDILQLLLDAAGTVSVIAICWFLLWIAGSVL
jgi:hypothetical protein